MTLPITLLIPIMAPLPMDHALRELQDKALEELRLVPSLLPLDSHLGDSCIRIRVIDESAQEPLLKDVWKSPSQVRQYRFLVIEADGHKCAENLRRDADASEVEKLSAEEFMWFSHQYAITCVQLEANTILLLANVIHPGALSADVGYTFIHEKLWGKTIPFFAEDLFSAVQSAQKIGWPPHFKVDFLSGWNWLREKRVLVDGIGVGRVGRALAAVSHLTTSHLKSTSSIDLVWILLGLESLYSKGNIGLKEQLLGKTEALLGPRTENKKAFGIVYDFRSRFLHGDVDLPLRFTEFNGLKKYEDFYDELSRNEHLALAVLLSTLQWMICHNATELVFEYALADQGISETISPSP